MVAGSAASAQAAALSQHPSEATWSSQLGRPPCSPSCKIANQLSTPGYTVTYLPRDLFASHWPHALAELSHQSCHRSQCLDPCAAFGQS